MSHSECCERGASGSVVTSTPLFVRNVLLGGLVVLATVTWAEQKAKTEIVKRLNASATVLKAITETPDKRIPAQVLAEANYIAVVPALVNVALAIGRHRGKGIATCHTTDGWSAPAPIKIQGGSIGLQIGRERSIW